jgi:hypothetical protein
MKAPERSAINLGLDRRLCGRQIFGTVQRWLAAQSLSDVAGFIAVEGGGRGPFPQRARTGRFVRGFPGRYSGVNPTRSQNSTEHTRRSATGARSSPAAAADGNADVAADDGGARSDSWCPHERQNGFPGVTGSPHDGHPPKGKPQSSQDRSPSPRDAPQRGHVTMRHLYPRPALRYMAPRRRPARPRRSGHHNCRSRHAARDHQAKSGQGATIMKDLRGPAPWPAELRNAGGRPVVIGI